MEEKLGSSRQYNRQCRREDWNACACVCLFFANSLMRWREHEAKSTRSVCQGTTTREARDRSPCSALSLSLSHIIDRKRGSHQHEAVHRGPHGEPADAFLEAAHASLSRGKWRRMTSRPVCLSLCVCASFVCVNRWRCARENGHLSRSERDAATHVMSCPVLMRRVLSSK